MGIGWQIFFITFFGFICFVSMRAEISGIISYQLNKNAYKKRKVGQTLRERFLYSRFREEIPKIFIFLHFFIIWTYLLALTICLLLYFGRADPKIGQFVVFAFVGVHGIWALIDHFLFWRTGPGDRIPYERWITKRRGQKKPKGRK